MRFRAYLFDVNDSPQRKYVTTMENKALDKKNPMISIIWPFKSRVKSDSLNTTRFLVVNGSIVDDPDTIYEQCSQHLLRYHNTESKISINTFSMLTSRHPPKIDFMSTNIKKAITVLKNTITVDLMGFLHHL